MVVVRKALPMLPMAPQGTGAAIPSRRDEGLASGGAGHVQDAPAADHGDHSHGRTAAARAAIPHDVPASIELLQERVGADLERIEAIQDAATRELVFRLLQGVDEFHRAALERLITRVSDLGGHSLRTRVEQDPVVRTLLDLYDLVPEDPNTQVAVALQGVYPYVDSHGGRLEILGTSGGRVRVRLSGSCEDCPGSSGTLRRVVEQALRDGLPWFREMVVEEAVPAPAPLPSRGRPLRRPRWVTVTPLDDIADGQMATAHPEGVALLLVRLGGEVYAYGDGCPPGSPLTLHLGVVDGTQIVCPWHGCRYDARTGRRLDGEGRLVVYPVAVRGGEVRIALGTQEVGPG